MNSVTYIAPVKSDHKQNTNKTANSKKADEFQSLLKDTQNKMNNQGYEKKLEPTDPDKDYLHKPDTHDSESKNESDLLGATGNSQIREQNMTEKTSDNMSGIQANLTQSSGLVHIVGQSILQSQNANLQQSTQNMISPQTAQTVQLNQTNPLVENTLNTLQSDQVAKMILKDQQALSGGKVNVISNQTTGQNQVSSTLNMEPNQEVKQGNTASIQLAKTENQISEKAETKLPNDLGVIVKTEGLDLNKVNIKVAENANFTKTSLSDQISDKILFNISKGKQEFDIQLYPKELGKIGIKLVFEGNGAQLLVSCSNPKTQSLMAIHADNLRSILEGNTGLQTTVSIQEESGMMSQQRESYDGRGQNQSRYQQENGKNQLMQDEEKISFLNQLKFGLLEQKSYANI